MESEAKKTEAVTMKKLHFAEGIEVGREEESWDRKIMDQFSAAAAAMETQKDWTGSHCNLSSYLRYRCCN